MEYNQQRVMHKAGDEDGCTGGWSCSKCGAAIEELPFKPDPARLNQLLCRDCHRARNQSFRR
jgi:formate-dependent nitrite reductase cytochrome c552 subunit